jgi:hypothetical protein
MVSRPASYKTVTNISYQLRLKLGLGTLRQLIRKVELLRNSNRTSAWPAGDLSSLASTVPSLSRSAALKRCSTTARYSAWSNVALIGIRCDDISRV